MNAPREDVLEHGRDREVPPLDAVRALGVEHALGPREPSARRADRAVCHEPEPDPERAAHRAHGVARIEVLPVRALEEAQVLVVQRKHVGADRETLEVAPAERDVRIGRRKCRPGSLHGRS